ncbi:MULTISPECIES: formyl transferase [unclassified Mesorhizobium]|uniref:glucosamine inositolphosphorylceramide transferase family protein n=1 Tax=unclassified Mesorhizobium TaxID=325217 RepID=UPI0011268F10|nr:MULTISPECIES: formyl transferase [unclassified Mesorhizobium]MBZ9701882.1 formyl transferase [Mesorhizobium sp. CO1-1-3]MBZ9945315.1 formyl transferase [Mesorhizobium sp. BR1-1-11]MCA0058878.1 formyl transferase [Mesorhizobium sp. B261B1A]TPJ07795.1 formyl transferase [Mesorhizobium sp. B2-8-1]
MQVSLRLDRECPRAFHLTLLERLAALAHVEVSVDLRPAEGGIPPSAAALFQLETAIHGLSANGLAKRLPLSALAPYQARPPTACDLVIDLCGDVQREGTRVWRVTYDGAAGEAALLTLILDGRTPIARIEENGTIVAEGRLGTEYGGIALASFQDMLARTASLILAAMTGAARHALPVLPEPAHGNAASAMPSAAKLGVRAGKALARRVVQKIYHLCYNAPHWKVGWRQTQGQDLLDLRAHPATGWQVLPDDGSRFYADPFPILHQGKVTLFVEDYIHRLGRAIISAVPFGPSGPIGRPEPVLDLPYHLSYPFVFERDGEVWMVPESCANRTVDLYRATAFPGGWVKEATLLSDIVASDATLVEHGGRWWLFATVRDGGGAFSDALHLWSAPDFRGPWTPHPKNPVLIDIASARPAGRMVEREGQLLRPVQDCRRSYGAALGIASIVYLDLDGMSQVVETILTPGALWSGRKLHTLNEAGGLEFIDGSAIAPRWKQTSGGR